MQKYVKHITEQDLHDPISFKALYSYLN